MTPEQDNEGAKQGKLSRRKFLTGIGVGTAAGAATLPQLTLEALAIGRNSRLEQATRSDRFGRMFPNLPSFAPATQPAFQRVVDALLDIGAFGHLLDAKDPIGRPPAELITDPAASANNRDNPNQTAGTTFLGQFLDHDMIFDATSRLAHPTPPDQSLKRRTPGLDLDSVYGGGPTASPMLYYSADRVKFRLESGGLFEDLPRAADRTAIIADPRNDENLMIAGLHAAFLLFHNRVVDHLRARGMPENSLFSEAQRTVRWHYQWVVVHEFLPQIVGQDRVDSILRSGRRFYRPAPGQQYIPVEFQGAAYRFGHSMVRPSYRANLAGDNGRPFFGMIFDPAGEGQVDPVDLRGRARAPRRFIGWQTFFDFGDGNVRSNKRIETKISTPLFRLPLAAIASGEPPIALPQRNLLRHLTWSIPSGQAIAAAAGLPALGAPSFSELRGYGVGLDASTPLWYYVLKEAELLEDGLRLGPVGALIVGEVFIGLLQLDPSSYLAANPAWRPTLPRRDGATGDFRMVDLLTYARVDPTSRGQ
jgi:hypothetical protein